MPKPTFLKEFSDIRDDVLAAQTYALYLKGIRVRRCQAPGKKLEVGWEPIWGSLFMFVGAIVLTGINSIQSELNDR